MAHVVKQLKKEEMEKNLYQLPGAENLEAYVNFYMEGVHRKMEELDIYAQQIASKKKNSQTRRIVKNERLLLFIGERFLKLNTQFLQVSVYFIRKIIHATDFQFRFIINGRQAEPAEAPKGATKFQE